MKCGYCNGTGEHINDANRMTTCEFCGGTGEVEVVGDSVTDVCDKCGGTGFFCEMRTGDECTLGSPCPHQKEPLTNEEWLRSCPPQELIRFLMNVAYGGQIRSVQKSTFDEEAEKWSKWLKEKHE